MINHLCAGITAITHLVLKRLAGEYLYHTFNGVRLIALYGKFKFHFCHIFILLLSIRFGTQRTKSNFQALAVKA